MGNWRKGLFVLLWMATIGSQAAMATYKAEQYFEGSDLAAVRALETGDAAGLQKALAAGADINRPGKQAVVPFLYFIATNNIGTMAHLVKLGAHLDYELPRALGPHFPEDIGWVVGNPDTRMLEAMLQAGMNPNLKGKWGTPLLYWTINPFNKAAFELLLRHGADINGQNRLGRTVLHEAIFEENFSLAIYLVEHGANPTLRTKRGDSALDLLSGEKQKASKGSPFEREIIQLLDYLAKKGYR